MGDDNTTDTIQFRGAEDSGFVWGVKHETDNRIAAAFLSQQDALDWIQVFHKMHAGEYDVLPIRVPGLFVTANAAALAGMDPIEALKVLRAQDIQRFDSERKILEQLARRPKSSTMPKSPDDCVEAARAVQGDQGAAALYTLIVDAYYTGIRETLDFLVKIVEGLDSDHDDGMHTGFLHRLLDRLFEHSGVTLDMNPRAHEAGDEDRSFAIEVAGATKHEGVRSDEWLTWAADFYRRTTRR